MTKPEDKKIDPLQPVDDEARRLARHLIRTARFGTVATLDPDSGHPLASRVALSTDMDGAPVFLTSTLSAHTGALLGDDRCSILIGEPGKGDPLAHPRISLVGRASRTEQDERRERVRRRYLARHPKASLYSDFADFSFWRMEPERASLNGGFARAFAMSASDVLTDMAGLDGLLAFGAGAVEHMNDDHADAVEAYATAFCGGAPGPWTMTGLDPEGLDLALGDDVRRLWFDMPMKTADEMRPLLVRLAQEARQKSARK